MELTEVMWSAFVWSCILHNFCVFVSVCSGSLWPWFWFSIYWSAPCERNGFVFIILESCWN